MEYACARLGGFIGSTGGCSPLFIIVECIVLVPSILGYIIGMVGPMVEPMEAMPPPTGVYVLITFVSAGCLNPAKSPPILARPVEIVEFVIIFYHIPHQGIVQAWSWRKSRPEEGGRIQRRGVESLWRTLDIDQRWDLRTLLKEEPVARYLLRRHRYIECI